MNADGTHTADGVTMTYAEAIAWAKAEHRAGLIYRRRAGELLDALARCMADVANTYTADGMPLPDSHNYAERIVLAIQAGDL